MSKSQTSDSTWRFINILKPEESKKSLCSSAISTGKKARLISPTNPISLSETEEGCHISKVIGLVHYEVFHLKKVNFLI